jgi:hypothetical protein
MERVISVKPLAGWSLDVTFADGTEGVISLEDRLFGPVFQPLRDPDVLAQVQIDEFGVVCWPNGADLAPDALYEDLKSRSATERANVSP